uniref:Uncharacterized protein n=1 Tax=Glossina austeni TaxID=7395 RepID=A0A1A9UDA2_GLOAU
MLKQLKVLACLASIALFVSMTAVFSLNGTYDINILPKTYFSTLCVSGGSFGMIVESSWTSQWHVDNWQCFKRNRAAVCLVELWDLYNCTSRGVDFVTVLMLKGILVSILKLLTSTKSCVFYGTVLIDSISELELLRSSGGEEEEEEQEVPVLNPVHSFGSCCTLLHYLRWTGFSIKRGVMYRAYFQDSLFNGHYVFTDILRKPILD